MMTHNRRTHRRVHAIVSGSWRRVRLYHGARPFARGHLTREGVVWDAFYGFVEAFSIDAETGSVINHGWTGDIE